MAITKLGHMKESSRGNPGKHLKNAIRYILNPDKTEKMLLSGGNSGYDAAEIYTTFMDTKKEFGKLYGRQGYHVIISFKPGEAALEQVYQLTKQWCEMYLGDAYDYVFAIHNDHEHLHGHVVFNSVSRLDGYKYRYEKGDWEKKIQPVTDWLCEEMGLPKLQFEQESKKKKHYAQWKAEKEGRPVGKDILQADIDAAIANAGDIKEFYTLMQLFGYEIRQGYSKKYEEEYLSFRLPDKTHARRSYCLDKGYHFADIVKRIQGRDMESYRCKRPVKIPHLRAKKSPEFSRPLLQNPVSRRRGGSIWFITGFQFRYVKRCYRAKHFQSPYAKRNAAFRQDIRRIHQLSENCRFLFMHQLRDMESVTAFQQHLSKQMKTAKDHGDDLAAERLKKEVRTANRILREMKTAEMDKKALLVPTAIQRQEGIEKHEQYRI